MKNTFRQVVFCFAFIAGLAFNNFGQIDQIIDKYNDTDGVLTLNISGNFFNQIDDAKGEAKALLEKMGNIKMIIAEDYSKAPIAEMRKELTRFLSDKSYKDLVKVKSDGDVIDFKFKPAGKKKGELIMLIDSDDSFVTLFIEGDFDMDDAKKIAKELQSNSDLGLGI